MQFITKENIKSIKRHCYFDETINSYHVNLNTAIYNNTVKLMMLAKQHLNKEVICLMDNSNLNNIGFNTSYSTDEVCMSDNMIRALLYGNTTFTAIHNHVDDNTFSLIDVVTFLTYAKLTTMIICTNSCKYSAACYKNRRIPNLIIHINQVINFIISKGVVDGHKSGLSLIKILSKLGILYVEYINY